MKIVSIDDLLAGAVIGLLPQVNVTGNVELPSLERYLKMGNG